MGFLCFDSLLDTTKKMLYPDAMITILSHQSCITTVAPGMLIGLEGSTQLSLFPCPASRGSTNDEEWLWVEADGLNDTWIEMNKGVPTDIGRGAPDVSKGTASPGQTKIVLQVIKEYYKKESGKAFIWRMEDVKRFSPRPSNGGFLDF
ncbi:hypothetical protein QM012_002625 [Aureobasidium pullulans]|uniref:Uncharacterized protein n=1 Tax=Aureobasidium pullulans TaxID=5580 RepID=A0ABR0TA26_AURPU